VSADNAKYWAFISYSHRDAKVATALQRTLESYRLPRRLVGTSTAVGQVPAYLKPVFRDRDELQAGADLKATVREALARSRYLIVVCSPDAVRSPWVSQEIIEFKMLHGQSRVLAYIAAGEPFASRTPGREADECLPEALRFALTPAGRPEGEALEPIAADSRPEGDGERRATLKLVAGMVGVGVDELIRRDAQRRARRMAMVAVASVVGMAVMTTLTVMAVQARNEAQRQRAQAEDLIEFMLGDLRKKLDPVGRLDVLDSVGEKALDYYGKQDTGHLDAGALGRRSRAMHLIGEMRDERGKLDEALAAFRSAADTTAELLERAPNDGQRIFDHAQSVYWVGYIAWRHGQAQVAEEAFLRYRELAQRLVRIDAANVDWQLETAYASQNLGVVQLDRWRLAEALQSFSEAKDVLVRLVRAKPELTVDLAENRGWMAKALEASGDYRGAIDAQQERLSVLVAATDSARDRKVQGQVQNASYELGRLQLVLGNPVAAETHARAAVERADALVSSDPANTFWLAGLCGARLSLAEIEFALGKRDLARADIEWAMPQISRLIASDTSPMRWQTNLNARALALKAQLLLSAGQRPSASDLETYLATVGRFESQGARLTADQMDIVAAVELILGDLLVRNGQRDAAAAHWRAVAERLRPLAEHDNLPALALLARAELRLGNLAEARALAARVEASNYRHPAYADLVNELTQAAGPSQSNPKPGRS